MHATFWSENLTGKDHLEDLCIDGRMMIYCILKKYVRMWTAFIFLRMGYCEYSNEPFGFKEWGISSL